MSLTKTTRIFWLDRFLFFHGKKKIKWLLPAGLIYHEHQNHSIQSITLIFKKKKKEVITWSESKAYRKYHYSSKMTRLISNLLKLATFEQIFHSQHTPNCYQLIAKSVEYTLLTATGVNLQTVRYGEGFCPWGSLVPLWTDPGLKNGVGAHGPISTY